MLFIINGIIAAIAIIIVLVTRSENGPPDENRPENKSGSNRPGFREWLFTPEYKRVGIRGEEVAARAIQSVLREGDRLFKNVSIEYDGKPAELDNVVVNKYGVFIIEVKNYTGHIVGGEDDYEWQKYKTTDAGNTYEKTVKNPIKQVKRQVYILARYLEYYGPKVWVRGYAILLHGNSPVQSEYMLTSMADIDCAIHTADRRMLDVKTLEKIDKLLSHRSL
ncbi:MAG: NERD domain-containing protein [Clostridia bacterium]|nr:NERD domain-containing protein [Clostridia bacterium]